MSDEPSELAQLVNWLAAYAEEPIGRELVEQAERRDLSAETLISLGHGLALTAVTAEVKKILHKRLTCTPGSPTR